MHDLRIHERVHVLQLTFAFDCMYTPLVPISTGPSKHKWNISRGYSELCYSVPSTEYIHWSIQELQILSKKINYYAYLEMFCVIIIAPIIIHA